jgi:hypothetical protein
VNDKSRSGATPNRGWFRKGRSGNPAGRPTASRAPQASAFDVVVERTLTVAHHGGTREITMEEALQQRTYRDALAGKRMAQREVLKWIAKREAWLEKHGAKSILAGNHPPHLARSRQCRCRSPASRDRSRESRASGHWRRPGATPP